jgi:hypothetical protein
MQTSYTKPSLVWCVSQNSLGIVGVYKIVRRLAEA